MIAAGGMNFRWRFEDERLYGELEAPTSGWLAVGFNHADTLQGATLVMGVVGDDVRVEEHFVHRPGLHLPEPNSHLKDIDGVTDGRSSTIRFSLPAAQVGGEPLSGWLILAYSHHADFSHHSAMRRHVQVG